MATMLEPAAVTANLQYYLEPHEGGTSVIYPGTAEHKLRQMKIVPTNIKDMRTCDEEFTLDHQGFQLVPHKGTEAAFDNDEMVKKIVYDETSELLKKVTGATKVIPFSHIMRKDLVQTAIDAAKTAQPSDLIRIFTPSYHLHVDQSYEGAMDVFRDNLSPADSEHFGRSRWGIINVWRPLGGQVMRDALGVCDASSVEDSDLRNIYNHLPSSGQGRAISKGKGFASFNIVHNPSHKWYYASKMTPEEVLMIKQYDSKLDGRARRTPHGAFPSASDQGPPRKSIEVRCLVFWEDQTLE